MVFILALEKVTISVTRDGKTLEKFFADYPNIRTLKGFLDGQWNFSVYDNCFPNKNRLSDVDASIELCGHTLVLEFKGSKNGMNKGQVLKAIRQAKYSDITTIFVFGKRNAPEAYLEIAPDANSEKGFKNSGYILTDNNGLCDILSRWCVYAKENNCVQSKTDEWQDVQKVFSALYSG